MARLSEAASQEEGITGKLDKEGMFSITTEGFAGNSTEEYYTVFN